MSRLVVLALLACDGGTPGDGDVAGDSGDADTDLDTDTDGDADTDGGPCVGRDEATCLADDSCVATGGYPVGADPYGTPCVDRGAGSSFRGCIEGRPCEDAPVTAGPTSTGDCWWFGNNCVPDGWVACGLGSLPDCP